MKNVMKNYDMTSDKKSEHNDYCLGIGCNVFHSLSV